MDNSLTGALFYKIYNEAIEEKNELQTLIVQNESSVEKINDLVKRLTDGVEKEYNIFSPRNSSHFKQSREDIKDLEERRDRIIKDNEKNKARMNAINSRIKDISYLLDHTEDGGDKDEYRVGNQTKRENFNEKIRILEIQEKERQRIARDLHDYSLQNLTHLIHKLELCSLKIEDDPIDAKLEIASVSKSLKEIIEDIRNTIFDLRPMPFDDLGITEVFSRLEDKLKNISDMDIRFDIDNIICVNNVVLITLFRIVQECATNSVKHSEGKCLKVSVKEKNDHILVTVEDDGVGFECDNNMNREGHFGLSILKERVLLLSGVLKIKSDLTGTTVEVEIPFKK